MGVSMPLFVVVPKVGFTLAMWMVNSGIGMGLIDTCCPPELATVVEREATGSFGRAYGISQVRAPGGDVQWCAYDACSLAP